MTELILHPGMSKCGSTAVQSIIRYEQFNDWLRTVDGRSIEIGWEIWKDLHRKSSERSKEFEISLYEDAFDHISDDILDGYRGQMAAAVNSAGTNRVIISQEGFSDLVLFHPKFGQRFVNRVLLPLKQTFKVRVIMMVRRQDQYLESFFSHIIKRGGAVTFGDFLNILPPERLSWMEHIDTFSQITSDGNVEVIPFIPKEYNQLFGKGITGIFVTQCGWDVNFGDQDVGNLQNPSVDPALHDVLVFVNQNLPKETALQVNEVLAVNFPKKPGEKFNLLSDETYQKLTSLFETENSHLVERFSANFPSNCLSFETR